MTNSPIFDYLFSRYKALRADGLDDTKEARLLFIEMIHYAPPEYMAVVDRVAEEMNLTPEPDGYLDDGTPMISLSALAKHHGMTEDEAEASLELFMEERESLGISNEGILRNPANIHRKQ